MLFTCAESNFALARSTSFPGSLILPPHIDERPWERGCCALSSINAWGWYWEQQTHFTQAFDSHKIMFIETFRALNTHVYRNIRVLKLIWENERTNLDTLVDKSMCTDLKCPMVEPLHSLYLTTTLIKMGLWSSLVVSFTCNSHSFCSWLNSSALKTFWIFCECYVMGRSNRLCKEFLCLSNVKFLGTEISWNFVSYQKFDKIPFFVLGKFRSKGLELSLELSRKLSWKVRVNKKRNSCISLALRLHNNVPLQRAHGMLSGMTADQHCL